MKAHTWETHEYDGGSMGMYDSTECTECEACLGFTMPGLRHQKPFLPDGSGLKLTEDCDESKLIVAAYRLGLERGKLFKKK